MTTDTSHHSHDDAHTAPDTAEVELPEPMAVRPDHASFGNCEATHNVDGKWLVEADLPGACRVELTISEARRTAAELLAAVRWAEQRDGTGPFVEGGTDGAGGA